MPTLKLLPNGSCVDSPEMLGFGPHIPFGGIKQSGIGVEFSPEGVKEFTGVHVVSIAKS